MAVDLQEGQRYLDAFCDLSDDTQIRLSYSARDKVNPVIQILVDGVEKRSFPATPPSSYSTADMVSPGTLACGSYGRFYYLHPFVGYLVAYTSDGEELWRGMLPGFCSLEESPESIKRGFSGVNQAFMEAKASIGVRLFASGDYLIAEYHTGFTGFRQIVYHRDGTKVAEFGRWDALTLPPRAKGKGAVWRFVGGGGTDMRHYIPSVEFEIGTRDPVIEGLEAHFLAWLMPRVTSRVFQIGCASRDESELQYWLKDAYDSAYATRTRNVLAHLGSSWAQGLAARSHVSRVLRNYRPTDEAWQAEYRKALILDGVDVEFRQALDSMERGSRGKPVGEP